MFNFRDPTWSEGFGIGALVSGIVIATIAGIQYLGDTRRRRDEFERWRKQLWGK